LFLIAGVASVGDNNHQISLIALSLIAEMCNTGFVFGEFEVITISPCG